MFLVCRTHVEHQTRFDDQPICVRSLPYGQSSEIYHSQFVKIQEI